MPDETATTDTTAAVAVTTEQPASPPAQEKSFSQEDVDRIVAKRLAEDRARRPAAQPTPPAPKPTKPADPSDIASELAAMKQQQAELIARLDFEKRTKGIDLDATKSDALFKVFQASPSAFDEAVQVFGIRATTQPVSTQAAPAKPVAEHPVSNRGAPPPAQTPLEEIDLYTATDSDRAAFLKAKGPKAYADLLKKQGKGRPVRF